MTKEVKVLLINKLREDPDAVEQKVASTIATSILVIGVIVLVSFFKAYIV